MRGCGISDEQEMPKEGASLRYMVNRYRQLRGRVLDICHDEPDSPGEVACLRKMMMSRDRLTRGRV